MKPSPGPPDSSDTVSESHGVHGERAGVDAQPEPVQEWRVRELVRLHDELDEMVGPAEVSPLRSRLGTALGLAVALYLSLLPAYLASGSGVQWMVVLVTAVAWLVYGGTAVARRRRRAAVERRIAALEEEALDGR